MATPSNEGGKCSEIIRAPILVVSGNTPPYSKSGDSLAVSFGDRSSPEKPEGSDNTSAYSDPTRMRILASIGDVLQAILKRICSNNKQIELIDMEGEARLLTGYIFAEEDILTHDQAHRAVTRVIESPALDLSNDFITTLEVLEECTAKWTFFSSSSHHLSGCCRLLPHCLSAVFTLCSSTLDAS